MFEVRFVEIHPNSRKGQSIPHSKLTSEFPKHPSAKGVSEKVGLLDKATAKSSIPSPPTIVAVVILMLRMR